MKRRIVLHLGLSKTGTTSIQMFLTRNRDALAARGVFYPDVSNLGPMDPRLAPTVMKPDGGRGPNHVALALELMKPGGERSERKTETPLWSAVFRQIEEKQFETTIISYENFYLRPETYNFDLISADLKAFDISGIIYLRPLSDWAVSLYCQHVKGVKRFEMDFSKYFSVHHGSNRYSQILDSIWESIPVGSLSIGDLYVFAEGDLIRDFFSRSGVAAEAAADDGLDTATNVSLPTWATLFLLSCNRLGVSDEAFLDIRKILSRSIKQKWAPAFRPGLDIATPDDRRKMEEIAASDADRLWERHGVKLKQRAREETAYRPFDDEDFASIRAAIQRWLSAGARSELDRVRQAAGGFS